MKNDWKKKKLGEICEIVNGGTPDTKVKEFWDGDNLWITPKDMGKLSSIYVESTERKITDSGLKNSSAKILPKNSVVLSSRAPIGHLAINTIPISTNQGCKGLVPKDNLNTLFLYYFLKNSVELLNDLGSGTTFKELSGAKLSDISILLPTIPEQEKIVSIINNSFSAIDQAKNNIEKNLKNAKEIFQSELNSIFTNKGEGWKETNLGEVSKVNYGYTEKASFKEIGPKFLRITDIQENGVVWETVPFCKCSTIDIPKYKLETGDIVFARTGATTGKSYLLNNPPDSVFASYLIRLKLLAKSELLPELVYYYFQTKTYWDNINAGVSGSAQGGFNASKLSELRFSYPTDIKVQQKIVSQMDLLSTETKKLDQKYKQKLNYLEDLKKSILQKAFNGELKTI